MGAASGAMGAAVASHNKGGQYLRARTVPSGAVPSPGQSVVRNAVSSLSPAWSTELTAVQRAAWSTYALNVPGRNRLGDAIQLSGQNWYIACNTPRLQVGLSRIDDAPVTYDRGTPTVSPAIVLLNDSAGTFDYGVESGTLTMDANAILYQGRAFNPGRSKYYGSFRVVDKFDLGGGASGGAFTPVFPIGSSENQMCFQLVFSNDDGRLSPPQRFTFPA